RRPSAELQGVADAAAAGVVLIAPLLGLAHRGYPDQGPGHAAPSYTASAGPDATRIPWGALRHTPASKDGRRLTSRLSSGDIHGMATRIYSYAFAALGATQAPTPGIARRSARTGTRVQKIEARQLTSAPGIGYRSETALAQRLRAPLGVVVVKTV